MGKRNKLYTSVYDSFFINYKKNIGNRIDLVDDVEVSYCWGYV